MITINFVVLKESLWYGRVVAVVELHVVNRLPRAFVMVEHVYFVWKVIIMCVKRRFNIDFFFLFCFKCELTCV